MRGRALPPGRFKLTHYLRDGDAAGGLDSVCKACRNQRAAETVHAKTCARCGESTAIGEFTAHKGRTDGRSSYCKPCNAVRRREWAKANPETARVSRKKGRRQTRPTPPEKRCRSCHETKPASGFTPDRTEADGLYSRCKRCRSDWAWGVDRKALFARDGGVCHICKKPADLDDFHVDHMFPLAAGGTNDPSNLAVSHPACNIRKGAKVRPVQLRLGA